MGFEGKEKKKKKKKKKEKRKKKRCVKPGDRTPIAFPTRKEKKLGGGSGREFRNFVKEAKEMEGYSQVRVTECYVHSCNSWDPQSSSGFLLEKRRKKLTSITQLLCTVI
jgi:hypothetical protein